MDLNPDTNQPVPTHEALRSVWQINVWKQDVASSQVELVISRLQVVVRTGKEKRKSVKSEPCLCNQSRCQLRSTGI